VIYGLEMKLFYWFEYFGLCILVVFFHVLIWVPQFLVDFLFKNLFLENWWGYQEGKFYDDLAEQKNGYFVLGCKFWKILGINLCLDISTGNYQGK
jgi:hypothetical protein